MSATLALILGSAAVGALISSVVNGFFSRWSKREELERRDMEMALKMAELKHQQVIMIYEWNVKSERDPDVALFDPLMSVISYCDGMKEYRKTGRWEKGEAGHPKAKL